MADEFKAFPMSALYLPGTVALPSPFPTVGRIWLPQTDMERMPGIVNGTDLVAIGNLVPPTSSIVRYILIEHISAIFLLSDPANGDWSEPLDWNKGSWLYSPNVGVVRDAVGPHSRAIIYVPESAPVMTQWVFGATAADSAEYRGTMGGGRCDC
jgi:hypothetical protein